MKRESKFRRIAALVVIALVIGSALVVAPSGVLSQSDDDGDSATTPTPTGEDGTYVCDDFDNREELSEVFDPDNDVNNLDRDDDGIACESLGDNPTAEPSTEDTETQSETATETATTTATETTTQTQTSAETETETQTQSGAETRSDTETESQSENNGTAEAEPEQPTASATFGNQTSDGRTVIVDSVTLSDGGFVAIHNASLLDGDALGSVVGVSEYLSAGTHENVVVTLFDVPGTNFSENMSLGDSQTLIAMPHLDTNTNDRYDFEITNGTEDGPYTENDSAVVDPASVTIDNSTTGIDNTAGANGTVYYQVDFVAREPIEDLRGPEGTYSNGELIRFAHGSIDDPITRRSEGEFTTNDTLADRIESRNITVENGTATTTFTVSEGAPVTLSLVSYTKPEAKWSRETEHLQQFVDSETHSFKPGTHTLTVDLPTSSPTNTTEKNDTTGTTAGENESTAETNGTNDTTTLTLLSYNDLQTAAAKNERFPRLVHQITERRAAHDNPTLVMGVGDEISPHALSTASQWRTPVDLLNLIHPTADTVGNHDLDYDTAELANATTASNFPWITTNLVNTTTGEPVKGTQRYTVIERDGVRIGVLGAVLEDVDSIVSPDLAAQNITAKPIAPTMQKYEQKLREEENADVVVALVHAGVPAANAVANETSVDAVLAGHDEVRYPSSTTNGAIVIEAQNTARYLGEINLTVRNGSVVDQEGRLINITNATPKNDTAAQIIERHRANDYPAGDLDSTLVVSKTEFNASDAATNYRETGLGDLVTDAMRNATGADVAITNSGGIRSNQAYGPGNITISNVLSMLPFDNTLLTLKLSGSELKETLASQVSPAGGDEGRAETNVQVSGVRFEWNTAANADEEIQNVTVNGKPLDPDEEYTVAANSFIAGGGDDFPLTDAPRLNETSKRLSAVLIEYLQDKGTVEPAPEGRIQRVGGINETSAGALKAPA